MASASRGKNEKGQNVRAVERAIDVLEAFSAEKPAMSVLEIQRKVRLSRPTLYRLLETLAARGFIRVHGTPQRFSLDYGVGRLARNWIAGLDPVGTAQPILRRLYEETRETVALAMLRGRQHIYVVELRSPHVLSMSRGIGPMDHLSRGASGKVILAFMEDEDRAAVLHTAPRGVDRKALLRNLAEIRRDGYWVARSEIFAGAVGIAAPFFEASGRVVGSIIVFGPEARFNDQRIRATKGLVVQAAGELSAGLGHVPGDSTARAKAP